MNIRFCILVLLLAVVPARAGAQASRHQSGPSAEYQDTLREALVEFKRGNWVEARALFERAHEINPSARTLRAIGMTAFEEKQYVTAFTTLAASLEDPRKPLSDAQRVEAQDVMRRADGFIARYTLELSPSDASLRVDAGDAVLVEGTLLLDPGAHELLVSAQGFQSTQRRISAQPGEAASLRVELRPNEDVTAQPVTTAAPLPMHEVTPTQVSHDEGPAWPVHRYVGVGVVAVGALALAGSVYFGLRAKSEDEDSGCTDNGCPTVTADRLNDAAVRSSNIATGLTIGGLVAVGTGVFLLVWSPSSSDASDESAGLHWAPSLSPMHAGLHVDGVF